MTVKQWLEQTRSSGELLEGYCAAVTPDDSSGWGQALLRMWLPSPDTRPTGTGVLLAGGEGSGRHTAALSLARELLMRNYGLVLLGGADLEPDAGEGFPGVRARLEALLDDFADKHRGVCMIVEDLTRSTCRRELVRYLGDILCTYFLCRGPDYAAGGPKDTFAFRSDIPAAQAAAPLFLILIEEREQGITGLLRSRVQLCRLTNPGPQERLRFLSGHEAAFIPDKLKGEEFVERTQGLSYAQLEDLVNSMNARADADRDTLLRLLESQLPAQSTQRQLLRRLDSLLEQLPALAVAAPAVRSVEPRETQAAAPAQKTAEPLSMDALEGEDPRDSAIALFGRDWVEAFEGKHKIAQ